MKIFQFPGTNFVDAWISYFFLESYPSFFWARRSIRKILQCRGTSLFVSAFEASGRHGGARVYIPGDRDTLVA